MARMLRLTEWRTGTAVLVRSDTIKCVRELETSVNSDDPDSVPRELGARTRIEIDGGDIFLVDESVTRISEMMDASPEPETVTVAA